MKTILRVLTFVLLLGFSAKADSLTTWDFSFFSVDKINFEPDGVVSGSGSFQTLPQSESPYAQSLEIVSTEGEVNGQSIGFYSAPYNAIEASAALDPSTAFLNYLFYFTIDGVLYDIEDVDQGPLIGDFLVAADTQVEADPYIEVTLVDPPADAPEASSFFLMLTGLTGLGLLWKRKSPSRNLIRIN
jgi:hypothetical protein